MRTHFIFVWAELFLGLTVACSDADPFAGATESAGGGAGGTTASAKGGEGGTAGGSALPEGGRGEATSQCWEMKPWTKDGCGTCEMTMEQYCADYNCTVDPLPSCDGLPDAYSIDEGCGLMRVRMSGHGGAISSESVYDLETRKLNYYYDNGGRSSGCMPELTVGVKPTCDSWTTLCEGAGGA